MRLFLDNLVYLILILVILISFSEAAQVSSKRSSTGAAHKKSEDIEEALPPEVYLYDEIEYEDLEDVDDEDVPFKDCLGTNNGPSLISTHHHESHYHRLAKQYENCTIITGNLEITHITRDQVERYDSKFIKNVNGTIKRKRPFWFLQNVREITGYLMIFYTKVDNIYLPNLKIIRGRTTFQNHSMYIRANNITYLRMPKFRSVLKGSIEVQSNEGNDLCWFSSKIDFNHLKGDSEASLSLVKAKTNTCQDESKYKCHKKCNNHCYGPDASDCQELYLSECPSGCSSCFNSNGTKVCCHTECAAGCSGLGPSMCTTCKNYFQDTKCVSECNGLDEYNKFTSKLVPRKKEDVRYFYESYCLKECPDKTLIQDKYCVVSCPEGHYRNIDVDRRKCIPCQGECPKVCQVTDSLDVKTLKELVNCTEIDGNLELLNHLFTSPEFTPSLLNNLRSVRIITGCLIVDGGAMEHPNKPTNLKFLENLKVIEGRDLHRGNALLVQFTKNLTELGLRSLNKISEGKVTFINNTQLCFGNDIDWKLFGAQRLVYVHNGDEDFCARHNFVCHDTCDPNKGCWGKGPSQCVQCRHFIREDECSNTCEEKEGFFRVGKNECLRCDRECSTCFGPTAYECKTCKNFRFEEVDNARFQCIEKCPNNTYAYNQDCFTCHDNCYDKGCNDGGSMLGTGCKECKYGVKIKEGVQCLAGSNVKDACQGWEGFYPSAPSTPGVREGECHQCRPECKLCEDWSHCSECLAFEVAPNNNASAFVDCALKCGEGTYELIPKTPKTPGKCQECHPQCSGCTGPSEMDCQRCRHFGVKGIFGTECVETCPPSHPYPDENFCHETDIATERNNRRMKAIAITMFFLVIIAIFIAYLYYRCTRYRKKYEQEQQLHMPEIPEHDKTALTRRPNMNRLTIITRNELTNCKRILGTGAFGTVYAGQYKVKSPAGKEITIPVAIKEIKMDSATSWNTENEMIKEATIMASLDHEHLLRLVGICFVDGVKLVTVLRPMGSLREFLIANANRLGARDLILYCYQISSAMEHLARHKIVHCDLAARNVLMRKNNHVEVTDFGLAKMLEGSNSSVAGGKIPFKWVPIECFEPDGEFSEASDVWAFGVTCWEIITYGATPYKEERIQKGDEMYTFLKNGHRLKQPANCSVQLHGTLISCWSGTPQSRPHFSDLKETFLKYCKVPTEYIQDRHITQRMDSYTGSDDHQLRQIQRLLSLTDSAMEVDEEVYTDQNGFQIVFNPITYNNLDSPRPMAISKKRHSSSASSRYKADPLRSHQTNTIDTRLTEVDTDEENYLVPNSAERVKLDPNGCKYTKVSVPLTGTGEKDIEKHQYVNDGVGDATAEYLNVDETTTEEEEGAFPFAEPETASVTTKPVLKSEPPPKESSPSHTPIRENKYINQAESVV